MEEKMQWRKVKVKSELEVMLMKEIFLFEKEQNYLKNEILASTTEWHR